MAILDLTTLSHVIYDKEQDISVLEAISKAEHILKRVINKDTGEVEKEEVRYFLKERYGIDENFCSV